MSNATNTTNLAQLFVDRWMPREPALAKEWLVDLQAMTQALHKTGYEDGYRDGELNEILHPRGEGDMGR